MLIRVKSRLDPGFLQTMPRGNAPRSKSFRSQRGIWKEISTEGQGHWCRRSRADCRYRTLTGMDFWKTAQGCTSPQSSMLLGDEWIGSYSSTQAWLSKRLRLSQPAISLSVARGHAIAIENKVLSSWVFLPMIISKGGYGGHSDEMFWLFLLRVEKRVLFLLLSQPWGVQPLKRWLQKELEPKREVL